MRSLNLTLGLISPVTYYNLYKKNMPSWRNLTIEINWDENEIKNEIKRKHEIMNEK